MKASSFPLSAYLAFTPLASHRPSSGGVACSVKVVGLCGGRELFDVCLARVRMQLIKSISESPILFRILF